MKSLQLSRRTAIFGALVATILGTLGCQATPTHSCSHACCCHAVKNSASNGAAAPSDAIASAEIPAAITDSAIAANDGKPVTRARPAFTVARLASERSDADLHAMDSGSIRESSAGEVAVTVHEVPAFSGEESSDHSQEDRSLVATIGERDSEVDAKGNIENDEQGDVASVASFDEPESQLQRTNQQIAFLKPSLRRRWRNPMAEDDPPYCGVRQIPYARKPLNDDSHIVRSDFYGTVDEENDQSIEELLNTIDNLESQIALASAWSDKVEDAAPRMLKLKDKPSIDTPRMPDVAGEKKLNDWQWPEAAEKPKTQGAEKQATSDPFQSDDERKQARHSRSEAADSSTDVGEEPVTPMPYAEPTPSGQASAAPETKLLRPIPSGVHRSFGCTRSAEECSGPAFEDSCTSSRYACGCTDE